MLLNSNFIHHKIFSTSFTKLKSSPFCLLLFGIFLASLAIVYMLSPVNYINLKRTLCPAQKSVMFFFNSHSFFILNKLIELRNSNCPSILNYQVFCRLSLFCWCFCGVISRVFSFLDCFLTCRVELNFQQHIYIHFCKLETQCCMKIMCEHNLAIHSLIYQ